MDPYFQLAQYILPAELFIHFELCRIEGVSSEHHLYLEENNFPPDSDVALHPNGFMKNLVFVTFLFATIK